MSQQKRAETKAQLSCPGEGIEEVADVAKDDGGLHQGQVVRLETDHIG